MYVQANIYMHAITINEKQDNKFEGIGEGIWKGLKQEWERRNIAIKLQPQ